MTLEQEIPQLITQLALKVLTPIMVFILLIFGGTGYFIFEAQKVSPTFNFNAAFWTWLIVFLAFTPLCGAILWIQSVKAINNPKKRRRTNSRPKVKQKDETASA